MKNVFTPVFFCLLTCLLAGCGGVNTTVSERVGDGARVQTKYAKSSVRPMIWVRPTEREAILRYQQAKDRLKARLPTTNAGWDPNSAYTFQPYFVEQKARTSASSPTAEK